MRVIIYGRPGCTFCRKAKNLCESNGAAVEYKTVGTDISKEDLEEKVGRPVRSVPQIFVMSEGFAEYVGGYTELAEKLKDSSLDG